MHSYQYFTNAALLAATLVWALGCGGDDKGGTTSPTQPPPAGATALAGTTGLAGGGTAGVIGGAGVGVGAAGRTGIAGSAAAGIGGAGRGVAGSAAAGTGAAGMATAGTGTAGTTAAGTGAAGMATAGTGGTAGMGAAGMGAGMCCPTGNCLCHGDAPSMLTSGKGPFATKSYSVSTGTIHYPEGASPPFAGVAVCGGFLNTGPEMDGWGSFYASYGIVTIVTTTGAADDPSIRSTKLLGAIKTLKDENGKSGSPLMGKMSDRYGTSGYSMGGGGTTIATGQDQTLKTSVGMAPWGGQGTGVKTPTLLFCGTSDTTAPCSMASGVFRGIADPTPKMFVTLSGTGHLEWVGSYSGPGGGAAAKLALAFQKVYLEGDERWKTLLNSMASGVSSIMKGNID